MAFLDLPSRERATGRSRRLLRALVVVVLWLATTARPAGAAAFNEYELKAVFLYNFAQFVEWPPTAFPEAGTPFGIGVLGDDPFGPVLDEVVQDETVRNRPFVVQRFRSVADVKDCHLLFVSRSEAERQEAIIAALQGRNILTVSDNPDFAVHGGMIRFVTEKSRVRLRINLGATAAAGLTVRSQLLRSAKIVTTGSRD